MRSSFVFCAGFGLLALSAQAQPTSLPRSPNAAAQQRALSARDQAFLVLERQAGAVDEPNFNLLKGAGDLEGWVWNRYRAVTEDETLSRREREKMLAGVVHQDLQLAEVGLEQPDEGVRRRALRVASIANLYASSLSADPRLQAALYEGFLLPNVGLAPAQGWGDAASLLEGAAMAFKLTGKPERQIETLDKLLLMQQGTGHGAGADIARVHLSGALEKSEQYREAITTLEAVTTPDLLGAKKQLNALRNKLNDQQRREAKRLAQEALARAPRAGVPFPSAPTENGGGTPQPPLTETTEVPPAGTGTEGNTEENAATPGGTLVPNPATGTNPGTNPNPAPVDQTPAPETGAPIGGTGVGGAGMIRLPNPNNPVPGVNTGVNTGANPSPPANAGTGQTGAAAGNAPTGVGEGGALPGIGGIGGVAAGNGTGGGPRIAQNTAPLRAQNATENATENAAQNGEAGEDAALPGESEMARRLRLATAAAQKAQEKSREAQELATISLARMLDAADAQSALEAAESGTAPRPTLPTRPNAPKPDVAALRRSAQTLARQASEAAGDAKRAALVAKDASDEAARLALRVFLTDHDTPKNTDATAAKAPATDAKATDAPATDAPATDALAPQTPDAAAGELQ